jgi:hypothetical protein
MLSKKKAISAYLRTNTELVDLIACNQVTMSAYSGRDHFMNRIALYASMNVRILSVDSPSVSLIAFQISKI